LKGDENAVRADVDDMVDGGDDDGGGGLSKCFTETRWPPRFKIVT